MENNNDPENPTKTGPQSPSPGTICSFSLIQLHPAPSRSWAKMWVSQQPIVPARSRGYTGSHRSVMLFPKNTITALTLTAINAAKTREKA